MNFYGACVFGRRMAKSHYFTFKRTSDERYGLCEHFLPLKIFSYEAPTSFVFELKVCPFFTFFTFFLIFFVKNKEKHDFYGECVFGRRMAKSHYFALKMSSNERYGLCEHFWPPKSFSCDAFKCFIF